MDINYNSPRELRGFLETHHLAMSKQFGQNFLVNKDARAKLLEALELKPGTDVWEIGPGLGAMTQGLLERGASVHAFEIDSGFCRILRSLFPDKQRFFLYEGDVFKQYHSAPRAHLLIGNLPYSIAAALLAEFIEQEYYFDRIVVTVQKEVADRMIARPCSHTYSAFSVLCASVYCVKRIAAVPARLFYPVPHVDSQGVQLDLRADFPVYPRLFRPLVRGLFSVRRKTIKNSLRMFLNTQCITGDAGIMLKQCAIVENTRAEQLSCEDFLRLAHCISSFI
ncbi:MAG: 16S rRNA (adenine(1518)-N(6)/adenine(1519)-N(6))-dimethyltransferase RsmA [Treponema sp.]|jgi:16S rRNA (adenine1518-N6/adenine1519-N6)-dimethyltransferase|nr:16S rRNA (adenine(1518)-N(6)/adenine(1519)-N(6))-dimethyltransferase RsmA [Treponema sp.]